MTNPGPVLRAAMHARGHDVESLAIALDVTVEAIEGMMAGDSPDDAALSRLPAVLGEHPRFWRILYSAPGRVRDSVLGQLQAA